MNRLRLTLLTLALAGSLAGGALAATQRATILPLPHWLPTAEKQTLHKVFGGAKPTHTYYISYSRKIAVIFEFNHVVICQTCGGPTTASIPRGKVIRVSFDRRTHRMNGAIQFCESRGTQPPRALCLRR
jgi:hypothetical protein